MSEGAWKKSTEVERDENKHTHCNHGSNNMLCTIVSVNSFIISCTNTHTHCSYCQVALMDVHTRQLFCMFECVAEEPCIIGNS